MLRFLLAGHHGFQSFKHIFEVILCAKLIFEIYKYVLLHYFESLRARNTHWVLFTNKKESLCITLFLIQLVAEKWSFKGWLKMCFLD